MHVRYVTRRGLGTDLPYEKCNIYFFDTVHEKVTKVVTHLTNDLMDKLGSEEIQEYWKHEKKFSQYTEKWIDWEHVRKSRKSSNSSRRFWLSKWCTGFCGVGKMVQRYGTRAHWTVTDVEKR